MPYHKRADEGLADVQKPILLEILKALRTTVFLVFLLHFFKTLRAAIKAVKDGQTTSTP